MDDPQLPDHYISGLCVIQRKLLRAKYFGIWRNRMKNLENKEQFNFRSFVTKIQNKKTLRNVFNRWRSEYYNSQISRTETSISFSSESISTDKYRDFYEELQELVYKNAELETKDKTLRDKIIGITGILQKTESQHEKTVSMLEDAVSRNEASLKNLAMLRQKHRDSIVKMHLELDKAKESAQLTYESKYTPVYSKDEALNFVKKEKEKYEIEKERIQNKLDALKTEAIDLRNKVLKRRFENDNEFNSIQLIHNEISELQNQQIRDQEEESVEINKDLKKLLKQISEQLNQTKNTIVQQRKDIVMLKAKLDRVHQIYPIKFVEPK